MSRSVSKALTLVDLTRISRVVSGMLKVGALKDSSVHVKLSEKLFWTKDGSHLLSLSSDNIIKIAELQPPPSSLTLKVVATIPYPSPVKHLACSPVDRSKFVIVGDEKHIVIWDYALLRAVAKIAVPMGNNLDVVWSPNCQFIAISNESEHVGVIDVTSSTFLKKMKHQTNQVRCMAWTFNSDYLLLGTGSLNADSAGYLELYSVKQTGEMALVESLNVHTSYCAQLLIDSSYRLMAIASADYLVSLWDLEDLICIQTLSKFDVEVKALALSANGKYIAVSTVTGIGVFVYLTQSGEEVAFIECKHGVKALAWNTAANVLAIAADDRPAEEASPGMGAENDVPRFRDRNPPPPPAITLVTFE